MLYMYYDNHHSHTHSLTHKHIHSLIRTLTHKHLTCTHCTHKNTHTLIRKHTHTHTHTQIIQVFDFKLSEEDITALESLGTTFRYVIPMVLVSHKLCAI